MPSDREVKTRTTTLPVIPTTQNGSGVATTSSEYYDNLGRLRWTQDGEGYINYYSYNPVTGGTAYVAVDVNPASPGSDITSGSAGIGMPSLWDLPVRISPPAVHRCRRPLATRHQNLLRQSWTFSKTDDTGGANITSSMKTSARSVPLLELRNQPVPAPDSDHTVEQRWTGHRSDCCAGDVLRDLDLQRSSHGFSTAPKAKATT
jgi:hypothetical protein